MALEIPTKIDFGDSWLRTHAMQFVYQDPTRGMGLEQHATIWVIEEDKPQYLDGGKFTVTINNLGEPLPDAVIQRYMNLRGIISNCVANAEAIVNRLRYPNGFICGQSADYKKGENVNHIVNQYEFMKLKSLFVDYIKENPKYAHLCTYGRKAGKPFRRELDNFVTYRNIFTHGALRVMKPSYDFCLEYIDNHTKKQQHTFVSLDIIKKFNNVLVKFHKLIDDFERTKK